MKPIHNGRRSCEGCNISITLVKPGELVGRQYNAWRRREETLSPWFFCRKCSKKDKDE